jgi:hypothetical protein
MELRGLFLFKENNLSLILGELKQAKIEKVTSLPTDSKEYRIVGYDGDIYFYDTSSYRKVIKEDSSPYFNNLNVYGNISITGNIDGRNISTDGGTLDFLVSVSGNTTTEIAAHAALTGNSVHGLGTASIHDFEDFQEPLSSGVNIKTINNQSIVGSGNVTLTGSVEGADHSALDNLAFADAGHTGFQASLVSGTNIKTINGESILGSGNLVVTGGGSGTSNHAALNNLDYASAAHTGFEAEGAAAEVQTNLVAASGNLLEELATHAALTGNSVHGLGTASIHDFGDFEEAGVVATHAALTGENVHGLGTLGTKTYWLGSQATYDGLGSYDGNTVYFIEE